MFPMMSFVPDCFTVSRGVPRVVVGAFPLVRAPRLVVGTRRLVVGKPRLVAVAPKVLSGTLRCSQTYHNHSHGTPVPVIRDPSYSDGWPECPSRVWYSPEIDASKFTLHILSDTAGDSQWLKYILLMLMNLYSYWYDDRCLQDDFGAPGAGFSGCDSVYYLY